MPKTLILILCAAAALVAQDVSQLRRTGFASASAWRVTIRAAAAGKSGRDLELLAGSSCAANGAEPRAHIATNSGSNPGELVDLEVVCKENQTEITAGGTVPVSGKFTREQREVYDSLVAGMNAMRTAIRPGATAADVRKAYEGAARRAPASGDLLRGLSGAATLKSGMVLTLEPQVVLRGQKLVLRIADTVLVTARGNDLLTAGLPRTADEVEAFLASPAQTRYVAIDAHNHISSPTHTAELLISLMNQLGIAKSIVFGGPSNETVLKDAALYPDRLIPFYRATVREEEKLWQNNDPRILGQLEREIPSGKWRGIGEFGNVHYPPWGEVKMFDQLLGTEVSPLAPMVISMFQLADKHHLPVLMHNEVYYYKELDELLTRFPRVKLIWAHAGYVNYYGVDMLMKKHPNLYADLSIRALYHARDGREASIFHDGEHVKPEWIETIEKYPDRFVVGLDEYSANYRNHEDSFLWMTRLLDQLKPETARKVARENIEALLPPLP